MHRHYTPEPVPEELLERLVYAAGRAPVAREGLRHIVVVTEPAVMASIRLVAPGFYNNAPALIAVCADLALATEVIGAVTADEVCALMRRRGRLPLARGTEARPGICWTSSWTPPPVQAVLGLPERIKPYLLVAVGRPAADAPKAPRRFEASVHRERWTE